MGFLLLPGQAVLGVGWGLRGWGGGLVAEVRGPRLQGGGGPGEAGTQESAGEGAQRGGGAPALVGSPGSEWTFEKMVCRDPSPLPCVSSGCC